MPIVRLLTPPSRQKPRCARSNGAATARAPRIVPEIRSALNPNAPLVGSVLIVGSKRLSLPSLHSTPLPGPVIVSGAGEEHAPGAGGERRTWQRPQVVTTRAGVGA